MLDTLQHKRPLAPVEWQRQQRKPDRERSYECEHEHDMPSVSDLEGEWLQQEISRWLELERTEARRLAWKLLRVRRTNTNFTALEEVLRIFWEHRELEQVVTRLKEAAKAKDRRTFLETLNEVDQRDWSAEDFVDTVRLALEAGAYLAARQISEEGANYYPNNSELQKYARALSPPRVVSSDASADSEIASDQEWLEAHRGEYLNQWVAVRDGKLLDTASSLRELTERVGDTEGALLTTGY